MMPPTVIWQRPKRLATGLLCLWVCALEPSGIQAQLASLQRWSPGRQYLWLRWTHQQVTEDTAAVASLAARLLNEAFEMEATPLRPALLKRLEALEARARELEADVAAANEHVLSVSAMVGAREIRSEARALRETLSEKLPGSEGKKLRELAREMEKRADAVYDRIRWP